MIIEQLSNEDEWIEKFKELGGISFLIRIYLETDTLSIKSSELNSKFSCVMIELLASFFPFTSNEPSCELITKILESLNIIASASYKDDEEASKVADHAVKMLKLLGDRNSVVLSNTIIEYSNLAELIKTSIIKCPNSYFGNAIVNLFLYLNEFSTALSEHLIDILIDLINDSFEFSNSQFYWGLLSYLIKHNKVSQRKRVLVESLLLELKYWKPEKSSKEQDQVLSGIIRVIRAGIRKSGLGIIPDTVQLVLHSCLFEIPDHSQIVEFTPPKCKNIDTRREAFRLLYKMCTLSKDAQTQVVEYLSKLHEDPHWRTSKYADWNYSPVAQEKSETGFVGLKNLGCICYMNSTIQQLFSVSAFREGILRAQDRSDQKTEDSLLHQLQYIFSGLKNSDKQHINPKGLCSAFKDYEGRSVNVFEQMDAEEFLNTFLDRLENQLKGDPYEHIIKNHFGGYQVTEIFGKDSCKHRSERQEPFLTFPVQVKNKKTLFESLESFIEGELLEGDNMYQCDYCEGKVPAIRRVCIKHLPNTFIISLRRFEFDFDTMTRVKVNDYCEFPSDIDMEPYTQEGLERKTLLKEQEQQLKEGKEFSKVIPNKKYPDNYYQFKLRGIVIHMGTAESGHYYSFIKDRNSEKWNEFNDRIVRPFNPEDIPNEAFGGEEKWSFSASTWSSSASNREKYRNAYLLLYERDTAYIKQTSEDESLLPLNTSISQGVIKDFEEVKDENERYWRCKSSFSSEYFDFISRLLKHGRDDVLKFSVAFFFTIMIRSKDVSRLPNIVNLIKEQLRNNLEVSEWILELITVPPVLKEMLMDCPVVEKRRVIVGAVTSALATVNSDLQEAFLQRLVNRLPSAKSPHSKHFAQYFEMIYKVILINPAYIGSTQLVSRLSKYLLGKAIDLPDFMERYKYEDIYLGYEKSDPSKGPQTDKYSSHEESGSLSYLFAIMNLGVSYLSTEEAMQLLEKGTMSKLSSQCTTKLGARSIGQFYSGLCCNNKEACQSYIDILTKHLSENDYDSQKPYLRQLTWIIKLEDSQTEERIEYALKSLLNQMKENKQYYKTTELCIEYFFKLITKVSVIRDWAYKKVKEFKWIETWLKDNQFPTAPSGLKSTMSIYKPHNTQWGSSTPFISRNNTEKIEFFKRILKSSVQMQADMWDSDQEMKDEDLQPEKRIDALDDSGQR